MGPSRPPARRSTLPPAETMPEGLWRDADFFEHQHALLADRSMTLTLLRVALKSAMNGTGSTGGGVTHDAKKIAEALQIGVRTAERHLGQLRRDGWHRQTSPPARGSGGQPGRRARYHLRLPVLNDPSLPPDGGNVRHIRPDRPPSGAGRSATTELVKAPGSSSTGTSSIGSEQPQEASGADGRAMNRIDPPASGSVGAAELDRRLVQRGLLASSNVPAAGQAIRDIMVRGQCDEQDACLVIENLLAQARPPVRCLSAYLNAMPPGFVLTARPSPDQRLTRDRQTKQATVEARWSELPSVARDELWVRAAEECELDGHVPTGWREAVNASDYTGRIRARARKLMESERTA